MRPILFAILTILSTIATAQRYADISVNNINATLGTGGLLYAFDSGWSIYEIRNTYEVPAGSLKNTITLGTPWVSALNAGNSLLGAFSGSYFNKGLTDGPVALDTGIAYKNKYRRVFKMTAAHISYHRSHYQDPSYIVPSDIAGWPANGNTSNGEPQKIAPFVDLNGNNLYEPELGDYPDIYGDEAIFLVLNDSLAASYYNCTRIHAEIHIMAYAFYASPDSPLFNTTFLHFTIFNRANEDYHDMRFSGRFAPGIQCVADDVAGCDTSLNSYFIYRRRYDPMGDPACSNVGLGYGTDKVAQGFTFLNSRLRAFAIAGYGTPVEPDCDMIRNMQMGAWYNGAAVTSTGNGNTGLGNTTSYIYSGDPQDSTQWSEIHNNSALIQTGRDVIGTVEIDTFKSGESVDIDMALNTAFAPDTALAFSEIGLLKNNIRAIQQLYDRGALFHSASVTNGVKNIAEEKIEVYPVPAVSYLYLNQNVEGMQCTIIDVTGREYAARVAGKKLDISGLAAGVYLLHLADGSHSSNLRFIKE